MLQSKLNNYLRESQDGKHEGSVISVATLESLTPDDKLIWREIRKELEVIGISVTAFDVNKSFILEWFRKALEEGAFEEIALDDVSSAVSTKDDDYPSWEYLEDLFVYAQDTPREPGPSRPDTTLEPRSCGSTDWNSTHQVPPTLEVKANPDPMFRMERSTPVVSKFTPSLTPSLTSSPETGKWIPKKEQSIRASLDIGDGIPKEQQAFEHLPSGIRASEVSRYLSYTELQGLKDQAIVHVLRFKVLSQNDVNALSQELSALDERCEYLRKTHRSLRSGRRNLSDRITTYLISPGNARFTHESIRKQEEALGELDSSVDDWVSKVYTAKSRRTRVRQKLMEHMAAVLVARPRYNFSDDAPHFQSLVEEDLNIMLL